MNQQVANEIIALELLTVLLEKPTDDSVEVAVGFVTECGSILQDLSPKGLHGGYSLNLLCGNSVLRFLFVNMLMNMPFAFFLFPIALHFTSEIFFLLHGINYFRKAQ